MKKKKKKTYKNPPPSSHPFFHAKKKKKKTSIKCRPYPQSKDEARIKDKWVKEQVALGRLQKGPSPIVLPVFHINKKDSDEKRIIMDYRQVNAVTVRDHNLIPSIRQAMKALHGNSLFSKFDIRWGYCNICIQKED